jgi:AcrR family transcriptional regulator
MLIDQVRPESEHSGRTGSPRKRQEKAFVIAEHAVRLFSDHGFAAVTIDQISAAAGIGTRTFFRYFPTKESAAFPDHPARVGRFAEILDACRGSSEPLRALLRASERLADDYFKRPDLYRPRYSLIRTEPVLRDYERVMDGNYEKLIVDYLMGEFPGLPDIGVLAPVLATGIVAAVNTVLQDWAVTSEDDPSSQLRRSMELLNTLFRPAFSKS